MEIAFIILGIWILYSRTWLGKNRSFYIIDDNVRRWDYLYVVPETSPPPEFYSTKPHPWRHFFLILIHSLNVFVLYLLFGWPVALLFAFHPINVNGAAWITGGYYAVTTFLSLTGLYFLMNFTNLFGAITGSLFFTAALGSTITCIGLPFVFLFAGPKLGLVWFWPLVTYLFGKRFRTGFAIRNAGKKDKVTWKKPAVMTKVVAYYIRLSLWPDKLAFFRQFGYKYNRCPKETDNLNSYNKDFWMALLVMSVFTLTAWQFSPLGTAIFLCSIGPFSQFKLLGQFVAERYLYLPNVGLCLILGNMLAPYPILVLAVAIAYIYRSHLYIPAFKSLENLYLNGIKNYPDCIANWCNLGERYLHTGKIKEAYGLLMHGLTMDNESFLAHCNLAAHWIIVKDYDKALYHTRMGMLDKSQNCFAERLLGNQERNLINSIKNNVEMKKNPEWEVEDEHKGFDRDSVGAEKALAK